MLADTRQGIWSWALIVKFCVVSGNDSPDPRFDTMGVGGAGGFGFGEFEFGCMRAVFRLLGSVRTIFGKRVMVSPLAGVEGWQKQKVSI
jgi:hypothetical protein